MENLLTQGHLFFKGVATAKNELDFDDTSDVVGTVAWQPPEIPEWTARGEVWVVAAMVLSLCRILPHGPIKPEPPNYRGQKDWMETSDARKGIRDLGSGPAYSQELDDLLWQCLRFSIGKRPLSYELVTMIRKAEAETLGKQKIPLEALPQWALKHG